VRSVNYPVAFRAEAAVYGNPRAFRERCREGRSSGQPRQKMWISISFVMTRRDGVGLLTVMSGGLWSSCCAKGVPPVVAIGSIDTRRHSSARGHARHSSGPFRLTGSSSWESR